MLSLNTDLLNRIPDIIKYLFVGAIAALSDLIIFYIFAKLLDFNYVLVTVVGFIVATFVNYILSIKFVFNSGARFVPTTEILMIYAISSIGLLVHISVLFLAIDIWELEKMLSKILAIISGFMFNFLLRKYYVFRKKEV